MTRRLVCSVAAGILTVGGIVARIENRKIESLCTAVNASGRRVAIGTVLTEAGREYKRANPSDDNNAILESLGGHHPTAVWTEDSIAHCQTRVDTSGAIWPSMFGLAVVFGGAALAPFRGGGTQRRRKEVFISYNHEDKEQASRLHRFLKEHGIPVRIDSENMIAGERIQDFIERSIRDSHVVVSIVSSRSLRSAWVAMETILTLQRNKWWNGKRFIACYLDESFFDPESRLIYTRDIDERLREIEELLPDYAAKKIDTVDLSEEKTRLYELRNNLGMILATLKESLCLDVREGNFEKSGNRLIEAIRARV